MGYTIENSSGFGISLDELTNEKEIQDILTLIANTIGKKGVKKKIKNLLGRPWDGRVRYILKRVPLSHRLRGSLLKSCSVHA